MVWYLVHTYEDVLNKLINDCKRMMPNETVGYLVGDIYQWKGKKWLEIIGFIPAPVQETNRYHAIVDKSRMGEIVRLLDEYYPDKIIVGWYHSHPGHGLFLSDLDIRSHQAVFGKSPHVALVVDPTTQPPSYAFFLLTENGYTRAAYIVWRRREYE